MLRLSTVEGRARPSNATCLARQCDLGRPGEAPVRLIGFNQLSHPYRSPADALSSSSHLETAVVATVADPKVKPFGWGKTIGGLARPMLRGEKKLDFKFTLTMAAYDLIKLPRLIGAAA